MDGGTFEAEGVLFDSDGVLVDSDESVFAAWSVWAEGHGLDPAVVLPEVHGRRAADTVAAFLPSADDRRVAASVRHINDLELESAALTRALPGALALLTSLPRDRWAVVTSATRALASARLAAAGLPVPPVLVTADDVARGKPAPDGYLAAAQALGVGADRCLVLEDSTAGVEAGVAAGARVIGVGLRDETAQVAARVADLGQVVRRDDPSAVLTIDVTPREWP